MPELYPYTVPPGFGDTWFQFAFNGDGLTPGQSYIGQLGIDILSGDYITRFWGGQETICQGNIQIYDRWTRGWYAPPGVNYSSFRTGALVLPEHRYLDGGKIRFDLNNAQPTVAGTDGGLTVYKSQLVFSGVKRRPNYTSDPAPSNYEYYEKPFWYPSQIVLNNYASTGGVLNGATQSLINIQDYDFELRRIEAQYTSVEGGANATDIKFMLYDNQWNMTANVPILGSRLFHFSNAQSTGQQNFFPAPGLLYKIGSVIRFDVFSLLFSPTALPQTFNIMFHGVRRVPCT